MSPETIKQNIPKICYNIAKRVTQGTVLSQLRSFFVPISTPIIKASRPERSPLSPSRGSFIITQKENKGEYSAIHCTSASCVTKPEWKWDNSTYDYDIYAHVVDQNGPSGDNGIPYRYANNTTDYRYANIPQCTNDYSVTHGKTAYSSISKQLSCNPNTLNAGNWYSFPAATAGSDNNAVRTDTEVLNSICPKGWRLPSNAGDKSYNTLIRTAYQIADGPSGSVDSNLLNNAAMSFVRLGHYRYDYGSLHARGNAGYYWSSTAYSAAYSRNLYIYFGRLTPQDGGNRALGLSVRCVSR